MESNGIHMKGPGNHPRPALTTAWVLGAVPQGYAVTRRTYDAVSCSLTELAVALAGSVLSTPAWSRLFPKDLIALLRQELERLLLCSDASRHQLLVGSARECGSLLDQLTE